MFHCLPSQLYKEDAELMKLIVIEKMGRRPDKQEGGEDDGE